jgi:hypothetical protein
MNNTLKKKKKKKEDRLGSGLLVGRTAGHMLTWLHSMNDTWQEED